VTIGLIADREENMKKLLKRAALQLLFSLAIVCAGCSSHSDAPSSSSASYGIRTGTYMICYTQSNAHGITVSSVFHVPPVDQVTMLEEPWAKDFRRYVAQSGDAGALSVRCTQVDPKNPDAALKDKIDAWRKQGVHVVQVSWKYAGG
jgi:hypothetical protein